MIKEIIVNNIDMFDMKFIGKTMQLQTINFLQKEKALNIKNCNCVKYKIRKDLQLCFITLKPLQLNLKKG